MKEFQEEIAKPQTIRLSDIEAAKKTAAFAKLREHLEKEKNQ